jgi:hypothetical protein
MSCHKSDIDIVVISWTLILIECDSWDITDLHLGGKTGKIRPIVLQCRGQRTTYGPHTAGYSDGAEECHVFGTKRGKKNTP